MFCERNYDRNESAKAAANQFINDCMNEANKLEEEKRKQTKRLHAILGISAIIGAVAAVVIGIGLRYEPAAE